jgi:hypothetical protein
MMNGLPTGLHKTILPSASGHAPHFSCQQCHPTPASWQQLLPPDNFINFMLQMMPPAPYHQMHCMWQQFELTPPPVAQPAAPAPTPLAGTMMVPYYTSYPQPYPFTQLGVIDNRTTKLNTDIKFTPSCSIPSHNYALAVSILLKLIDTNAKTIKQWVTLDSGSTSHLVTTNVPATNILPTDVPIVACLSNGEHVRSTHMCTLDIPSLPHSACAAHIIPTSLALHSLLSIVM